MVKFVEMDANVSLGQRFEEGGGPVILVNKFDVDAAVTRPILHRCSGCVHPYSHHEVLAHSTRYG